MAVLPITQLVRNAIARVLADAAPESLPTPEILSRLAHTFGCNHAYRRTHDDPQYVDDLPHGCNAVPKFSCHGGCWHNQAYPNLRALARHGSLEWAPGRYPRREAHWRYIPDPVDADSEATCDAVGPEIVDLDAPGT